MHDLYNFCNTFTVFIVLFCLSFFSMSSMSVQKRAQMLYQDCMGCLNRAQTILENVSVIHTHWQRFMLVTHTHTVIFNGHVISMFFLSCFCRWDQQLKWTKTWMRQQLWLSRWISTPWTYTMPVSPMKWSSEGRCRVWSCVFTYINETC